MFGWFDHINTAMQLYAFTNSCNHLIIIGLRECEPRKFPGLVRKCVQSFPCGLSKATFPKFTSCPSDKRYPCQLISLSTYGLGICQSPGNWSIATPQTKRHHCLPSRHCTFAERQEPNFNVIGSFLVAKRCWAPDLKWSEGLWIGLLAIDPQQLFNKTFHLTLADQVSGSKFWSGLTKGTFYFGLGRSWRNNGWWGIISESGKYHTDVFLSHHFSFLPCFHWHMIRKQIHIIYIYQLGPVCVCVCVCVWSHLPALRNSARRFMMATVQHIGAQCNTNGIEQS